MPKRNRRVEFESGYVSYADVLEWQADFAKAYKCIVEWKLTLRREKDGALGCYITCFVKAKHGEGGKLLGQHVIRFGRDQEAATLPAAMLKALILMDRDLGGALDSGDDDDGTTDPAAPLF